MSEAMLPTLRIMSRPCSLSADIIRETEERTGKKIRILDIGGGFPVKYHPEVKSVRTLAKKLEAEIKRLFPMDMEILARTGAGSLWQMHAWLSPRWWAKRSAMVSPVITLMTGSITPYSGQAFFDYVTYPVLSFEDGETQMSAVFGPTCDAFDTITLSADLPSSEIGDLVYSENIGAYSHASSTYF